MNVHTNVHTHIRICTHIHMNVTHTHIRMCTHTHMNVKHTHTHTHTHHRFRWTVSLSSFATTGSDLGRNGCGEIWTAPNCQRVDPVARQWLCGYSSLWAALAVVRERNSLGAVVATHMTRIPKSKLDAWWCLQVFGVQKLLPFHGCSPN